MGILSVVEDGLIWIGEAPEKYLGIDPVEELRLVGQGGFRTAERMGAFGEEMKRANIRSNYRIYDTLAAAYENRKIIGKAIELCVQFIIIATPESLYDDILIEIAEARVKRVGKKKIKRFIVDHVRKSIEREVVSRWSRRFAKRVILYSRVGRHPATAVAIAAQIQGVIGDADYAMRRLQRVSPELYAILYRNDVAALYFLIEPYVGRLLELISTGRFSPSDVAQIIREFDRLVD